MQPWLISFSFPFRESLADESKISKFLSLKKLNMHEIHRSDKMSPQVKKTEMHPVSFLFFSNSEKVWAMDGSNVSKFLSLKKINLH